MALCSPEVLPGGPQQSANPLEPILEPTDDCPAALPPSKTDERHVEYDCADQVFYACLGIYEV